MGRPKKYNNDCVSVTEVIGILNKPFLIPWAVKLTSETIEEKLLHFDNRHIISDGDIIGICKDAKKGYIQKRDTAGNVGKAIHNAIELYLLGKSKEEYLNGLDDNDITILNCFLSYITQQNLKIVLMEEPLYSKIHLFAGTPDLICTVGENKTLELRDWKVKTQGDYYEIGLQIGGYSILYEETFGKPITRAEACIVTREAKLLKPLIYEDLGEWRQKFLNLLQVYKDKKVVRYV